MQKSGVCPKAARAEGSNSFWNRPVNAFFDSVLVVCFPGGSDGIASVCSARDLGLTPRSGKSPGERNGNSLQCSCLENPRDGGAWWAAVYGVTQSQTRLK